GSSVFPVKSPTTASDRPYIGELSITLLPFSIIISRICSKGSRSEGDVPTSNCCHVPSPMTGSCSPVEGIVRFKIFSVWSSTLSIVPETLSHFSRSHGDKNGDAIPAELRTFKTCLRDINFSIAELRYETSFRFQNIIESEIWFLDFIFGFHRPV